MNIEKVMLETLPLGQIQLTNSKFSLKAKHKNSILQKDVI